MESQTALNRAVLAIAWAQSNVSESPRGLNAAARGRGRDSSGDDEEHNIADMEEDLEPSVQEAESSCTTSTTDDDAGATGADDDA